ncbi:alkaline phosphatase [Seminavis robusta]|uniref:Alkaline phosphatase n=1 Tax=Seminavis robusta TaxID=568900 RepID=A0A9N8E4K4_9STRA|nr:alkaline phosphatase [Seminavis robusta]|eukprot:Sro612_g175450.1 alkaline phosphatase (636) ;mRNA; r:23007-25021
MFIRSLALLGLAPAFAQVTVDFHMEPVAVPETGAEKHSNIATAQVTLNDVVYETSYVDILRSGDSVDGVVFGAVLDENQTTVYAYPMDDSYVEQPLAAGVAGLAPVEATTEPLISNIPDFTSLIKIHNESFATEFAMFAHFETPLPASIYRINVDFSDTCSVEVDSLEAVDFSAWGGLWEPCSAKVTPWNTHLGSEEHEPDAKLLTTDYATFMESYNDGDPSAMNIIHFMRYFGWYAKDLTDDASFDALKAKFNPYHYGHVTELSVNEAGDTYAHKWYTTGRVSIENPEIMGDNKTIYIADDANFGILTRFVMDEALDMSSGSLYAAKWNQRILADTDPAVSRTYGGVEWDLDWIELGSATQDELLALAEGLTWDQIFEEGTLTDGACATGFTYVKAGWGLVKEECLMVKTGMETAAAFFETRRYAAMLGASAELQSTEGLAFVPSEMKFYAAMSKVTGGMDETVEPLGDIAIPANPCGCVFQFDVGPTYELTVARAFLCGEYTADSDPPLDPLNSCSTESIASPDNLFYMGHVDNGPHRLLIAEDTSHHQNDYLWSYNFETEEMTRILSSVYGSQITSPGFFSDDKGCYLLMAVVPHPYKKSDKEMVNDAGNTLGLAGSVGYIGPIGSRSTDEL